MYKSRFKLWILIGIFYLAFVLGYDKFVTFIHSPNNIYFSSNSKSMIYNIENQTVNFTTKMTLTKNDENLKITEGERGNYFSPIIGLVYNTDNTFDNGYGKNELPLSELLDGYFNELCYGDCMDADIDWKNKPINIVIDKEYEDEIRALFYFKYPKTNWDNIEKIDIYKLKDVLKYTVIIAPEYKLKKLCDYTEINIDETIGLDFSVIGDELFNNNMTIEKFMNLSGLRYCGYKGSYNNDIFKFADWNILYTHNTDIDYNAIILKEEEPADLVIDEIADENDENDESDESDESASILLQMLFFVVLPGLWILIYLFNGEKDDD